MAVYWEDLKPTPGSVGTRVIVKMDADLKLCELVADCIRNRWPMGEQLQTIRDLMLAGF